MPSIVFDASQHLIHSTATELFIILSVLAITYAVYVATSTAYDVFFGPLSKFPGPKLWAASRLPLAFVLWTGRDAVAKTALHERYGPAIRISPSELSFDSGEAWKAIYGHRIGAAKKSFLKDPNFYTRSPNGAWSIIATPTDADHTRQRRILTHSFSDRSLKGQEPLFKEWAQQLVLKLREVSKTSPVDMLAYYNFLTFDVMADLTFAEPLYMLEGSKYSSWVRLIFDGMVNSSRLSILGKLPILWIIPALLGNLIKKTQVKHLAYSSVRVDKRLANPPTKPNIWTEVIERGEKDEKMSLAEMHANSSAFMIAGTETTATWLSGLTYYLLRNPSTMTRLKNEIRTTFASEADISIETLAALPYLNACMNEGLRMYPPVPTGLPRKMPAGGALVGEDWVPEGTTVAVTQLSAYRSKRNWFEPYQFLPERWLEGRDACFAADDHASFQPFSTGPRNCIGKNLAWHEARLMFSSVLWNFDFELTPECEDWADQGIYTLWDKGPLMIKLTPVEH